MNQHRLRRGLRDTLRAGTRVVGTFVKLPTPEIVELAADAGFGFVVVDLEHSTLSEHDALGLVRHADACSVPALVRIPQVDTALINRLLESGAAGIQLSMLRAVAQAEALRAATRFAPGGIRSVSLANRVAGLGGLGLGEFLDLERADPPVLVGQIETAATDPLDKLLPGLDVCFVGSTDLAVDLGPTDDAGLRAAIVAVQAAARDCGVTFGGWAGSTAALDGLGLATAGYLVIGSDLQLLAAGLRAAAPKEEP